MVPKAQQGPPWFGRYQHEKQNKQTNFLNFSDERKQGIDIWEIFQNLSYDCPYVNFE